MDAPAPRLAALLDRHPRWPSRLLPLLQDVQQACGHVPADWQDPIAAHLGVPVAQLRAALAFYHFLSDAPQGDYRILFSDNVTDRFDGSLALLERLAQRLGVAEGAPRADERVSLSRTSCIGLPDQGPAALVNGRALTRLTPARIDRMARLIEQRMPPEAWPQAWFRVEPNIRLRGPTLATRIAPGAALRRTLAEPPEALIAAIERAGLRGRGGAGFATGLKWRLAREAPGRNRCVIANADEGEPGTFKDRVLLATHADTLFEGMTLAAYAIGASRGFLYLRGEYASLLPALEATLARRRAAGLLGQGVCGSALDFDIEIRLGAGAYICGEETALIESLEGRRGIPRLRPPFPVEAGFEGAPTVCNNVETLVQAAQIALNGPDVFAALGTAASRGSKLLSVSGDVARPGVYEFPFGVTVEAVLAACGAADTQAVQVGGPSGTLVAPAEFGRRLAFEDLSGGGSFMVFDTSRDLLDIVRQFAHFFAFESCGFCTPCRVGTPLLARAIDRVCAGQGSRADLSDIEEIGRLVREFSHCGLGQTSANPLTDSLARFRPLYEARLAPGLDPVFDLERAQAEARTLARGPSTGAQQ